MALGWGGFAGGPLGKTYLGAPCVHRVPEQAGMHVNFTHARSAFHVSVVPQRPRQLHGGSGGWAREVQGTGGPEPPASAEEPPARGCLSFPVRLQLPGDETGDREGSPFNPKRCSFSRKGCPCVFCPSAPSRPETGGQLTHWEEWEVRPPGPCFEEGCSPAEGKAVFSVVVCHTQLTLGLCRSRNRTVLCVFPSIRGVEEAGGPAAPSLPSF